MMARLSSWVLARMACVSASVLASVLALVRARLAWQLAAVLTALAIASRIGTDFLETMTSMFNPLPAIALLPLALIALGYGSRPVASGEKWSWPIVLICGSPGASAGSS